ncbi:olfactory receptor 10AG1-like [Chroicocephalus ridibundus]
MPRYKAASGGTIMEPALTGGKYPIASGCSKPQHRFFIAFLTIQLSAPEKMPQRKGLENHTGGSGFILLGFSDHSSLQGLCFTVFLVIYLMVLTGNSLIVLITVVGSSLHSPTYFFLRNLSFLEICYTTVTLPKMLVGFLLEDGRISFLGCAAQLYFLVFLGSIECLLAVIAYDRYIAICDLLHYPLLMRRGLCIRLVVGLWVAVVPVQVGQTYQVFTLPFCASHDLHHFFCYVPPVLELACADTYWNQVTLYTIILVFAIFPFSLIVISYIKIIRTILKIPSVLHRHKAFSTCSSHLAVGTLFYGSATVIYLKQRSRDSIDTDKYLALFYTIVTPMFNPVIYSLRNKEVRIALKRLLWAMWISVTYSNHFLLVPDTCCGPHVLDHFFLVGVKHWNRLSSPSCSCWNAVYASELHLGVALLPSMGRQKAFSTVSSHHTGATPFYGTPNTSPYSQVVDSRAEEVHDVVGRKLSE